jgi:hypothetical protein
VILLEQRAYLYSYVPKYRVNEDGSLGEFNDVHCTGIEHKMVLREVQHAP